MQMRMCRAALKSTASGLLLLGVALLLLSMGCTEEPPSSYARPYPSLTWTPDGSHILFSHEDARGTFVIDAAGTRLNSIPENTGLGDYDHPASASASLSPDGSRVAYAVVIDLSESKEATFFDLFDSEIMVANLDGTGVRRLTHDVRSEDFSPAWSPDGNRIAFIKDVRYAESHIGPLAIMNADGSDARTIRLPPDVTYVLYRPVWSPDGSWIAAIGGGEALSGSHLFLVRPDGSGVLNVGPATGHPAWSPDSSRLAFFQFEYEAETWVLYTANANGTDRRRLAAFEQMENWSHPQLSWSPDGSALLFAYEHKYGHPSSTGHVVGVDDGSILANVEGLVAAWSPDGSRIAVLTRLTSTSKEIVSNSPVLYTMAWDGSDIQVLVRETDKGLVAENSDWRDVSGDIAACADLYGDNPGLAADCRALLRSLYDLAGDTILNWSAEVPIERWQGVVVEGDPPRVRHLGQTFTPGLNGVVPPALGSLDSLEILLLPYNSLTGSIPAELGNLSELKWLGLEGNALSGSIPAELGELRSLIQLDLKGNQLSGSIPPELGNLTSLQSLNLGENRLTGSIPPELGNLAHLRVLIIDRNNLSGCVPSALSDTLTEFWSDGLEFCK